MVHFKVTSGPRKGARRRESVPFVPASFSCTLPIMPRDAILLSDMRVPVLTVVCDLCQRHERFDVESLKRQHGGDMKMPDLLAALVADCPKTPSFSIYDRCKAVFERMG